MQLKLFIGLVSLALAGCASYEMPQLNESHPAYVEKTPGSSRAVSTTLAYTREDIPSPRPIAAVPTAQQGGHDGHQVEGAGEKTVTGEGKVVATVTSSGQLVVEHGAIEGFMDAMTMGYRVEPPSQLESLKPGDRVRFTINVAKKSIVKIEKLH